MNLVLAMPDGLAAEVRLLAAGVFQVIPGEVLETAEQSGGNRHQQPLSGSLGLFAQAMRDLRLSHPRGAPVLGVWLTTYPARWSAGVSLVVRATCGFFAAAGRGASALPALSGSDEIPIF